MNNQSTVTPPQHNVVYSQRILNLQNRIIESANKKELNKGSLQEIFQDTFNNKGITIEYNTRYLRRENAKAMCEELDKNGFNVIIPNIKAFFGKTIEDMRQKKSLVEFANFLDALIHESKHIDYALVNHTVVDPFILGQNMIKDKNKRADFFEDYHRLSDGLYYDCDYDSKHITGSVKSMTKKYGENNPAKFKTYIYQALLREFNDEYEAYTMGHNAKIALIGEDAKFSGQSLKGEMRTLDNIKAKIMQSIAESKINIDMCKGSKIEQFLEILSLKLKIALRRF